MTWSRLRPDRATVRSCRGPGRPMASGDRRRARSRDPGQWCPERGRCLGSWPRPRAAGIDGMRLRSFIGLTLGLVGPGQPGRLRGAADPARLGAGCRAPWRSPSPSPPTASSAGSPIPCSARQRPHQVRGRSAGAVHGGGAVHHGRVHVVVHLGGGVLAPRAADRVRKTASVMFGLTNVAVIPETFGKSRR